MTTEAKNATPRGNAPFRNDIVGSFLRPEVLKTARFQFSSGEISSEELAWVENEQIQILVQKQKAAGLKAVTDGEFRRSWWHLDFMWGLEGVERSNTLSGYRFHGKTTRPETASLSGKIRFGEHPFLAHFEFLRRVAGPDVIARQTIPAPAQFLAELQRDENRPATQAIYPDQEELFTDIATVYKDAIQAFYDLGCRNLQLDDCTWGMFCDKTFWEKGRRSGLDTRETVQQYLDLNNTAIAGKPSDMALTTHVCRGNYQSTWSASGGYEPVSEFLFGGENVDAYYLEYDTDRAGDFSPLDQVSENKLVVLGLVSSKSGKLENKNAIIRRIEEAAAHVPLDRLCLSPQCGFASTEEGNLLTETQQWEKLGFIKEIADQIWIE